MKPTDRISDGSRGTWFRRRASAPVAPSRGEPSVRLFHVSKSYVAGSFALHDVSLEFAKGELVFLTGPSGAGKTSLLRLLFGAERPSEGQIVVLGRNIPRLGERAVPPLRRRIGVVFQDFKLLPRRTVEENVAVSLDVLGTPRRAGAGQACSQMLKQVGLQHRRTTIRSRSRAASSSASRIARALVNEPDILLADEPTGNLDPELTLEIMDLIANGRRLRGTTVIVATHDLVIVVNRYGKRDRAPRERPGASSRTTATVAELRDEACAWRVSLYVAADSAVSGHAPRGRSPAAWRSPPSRVSLVLVGAFALLLSNMEAILLDEFGDAAGGGRLPRGRSQRGRRERPGEQRVARASPRPSRGSTARW